jgi:hypothetical protein
MLSRNDQPYMANFNFATDSVINNVATVDNDNNNVLANKFLFLDTEEFLLLSGANLLLLGT